MKPVVVITGVALAVVVAAGSVAYTQLPVVRYFLMPVTGSTPAPGRLLGGGQR